MVPYWWGQRKKSAANCSRQAHGRLCHHVTQWHSAAPADIRQIFNQHASRQASAAQPVMWSAGLQHMSNMPRISLPYRASLSLTSSQTEQSHKGGHQLDKLSFKLPVSSHELWQSAASCDQLEKHEDITNTIQMLWFKWKHVIGKALDKQHINPGTNTGGRICVIKAAFPYFLYYIHTMLKQSMLGLGNLSGV